MIAPRTRIAALAASLAIVSLPGDVVDLQEGAKLPTPDDLRAFAFSAGEVPGFDASAQQVHVTAREISMLPTFALVVPNTPFKPGRQVALGQKLTRPSTGLTPRADLRLSITLFSDPSHAVAHAVSADGTVVQQDTYITRGDGSKVLLKAGTRLHSRALVGPEGEGTFTGFPLGRRAWMLPVPDYRSWIPAALLRVLDGNVLVKVEYSPQAYEASAMGLRVPPLTDEVLEVVEYAARLGLSKGYMALLDFKRLPAAAVRVGSTDVRMRKAPDETVFAPAKAVATALGGRMERELGMVTISANGRTVTAPIGSRELLVGGKSVSLPLPVLFDGEEVWIEKKALAKALGVSLS
ncbi:MAG: hypothetical protein IH851_04715 [Armatimonadetes bacterium]|nr:hypothetical protein [Armatimonadota bacterium]